MSEFYQNLSTFYDFVFPVSEEPVRKIASVTPIGGSILDVACGNGGMAIALAREGFATEGVDLDFSMISIAEQKACEAGVSVPFRTGSMLELAHIYMPETFDTVSCVGNSLVHLTSTEEISSCVAAMSALLKPGGRLVIQILNYDRVLRQKVTELPTLMNQEEGVTFLRSYVHDTPDGRLDFNTCLKVDRPGERFEAQHSVRLYPLLSSEMLQILTRNGLTDARLCSDFRDEPFSENGFMLVVSARKPLD